MLVGRITKAESETSRITVDFGEWLDSGTQITAVTTPTVVLEANAWPGPWPPSLEIEHPAVLPVDTDPLVCTGIFIVSGGRFVQLYVEDGTIGVAYALTFVATSGTRTKEVRVDVSVRASGGRVL